MKRTATLQVLDEYAKKLSKKQANMLYEAKMNKKYSKRLYESDDFEEYTLYLDEYIIADNGLSDEEIQNVIDEQFGMDVKVSVSSTGLMIYVYDRDIYGEILELLEDLGIPTEDLNDSIDPNYLHD